MEVPYKGCCYVMSGKQPETQEKLPPEQNGLTRYSGMPGPVKVVFSVFVLSSVSLFIYYTFGFNVSGYILSSTAYYYLLYVLLMFCIFVAIPARKKDRGRVPWYDITLGTVGSGIALYWFLNARSIATSGWIPAPSVLDLALACIFGLLALESGRRVGHLPFLIICLALGLYPVYAEHMPGLLYGFGLSFDETISHFAYGFEGVLGLPARVMGEIIIGYLLFAGIVLASGAGEFFTNIALVLLGKTKGGAAKIAVVSSGFFGSLSGAPVANVVATGSFTIPTMKKLGYPSCYAAAIEACASTGGAVMPPVMASVAFIMAEITSVPYATIVIAAIIPACLYYYGLFIGVDAYARKVGLKGVPREDIPSLKRTLIEGWPFIAVLIFLVWGLVYMRWSVQAPIYASALMILLSFTSKNTKITSERIGQTIARVGDLITMVIGILLPVGLLLSGLRITGTTAALTTGIVSFAGGNLILILLIGIVTCYVMGMGGMGGLAYIFLGVTIAPALVSLGGLNIISVHFFILYYALTSGITPPIAVTSWVAAAMAEAPPMKTSFTSMRLAVVLYFVPFFFLFNPALILQGPSLVESLYLFLQALLGVTLVAAGLEGYLLKFGVLNLWMRPLLVVAGLLIGFPEWNTTLVGISLAVLVIAPILILRGVRT